jgi:ribonuclease HI
MNFHPSTSGKPLTAIPDCYNLRTAALIGRLLSQNIGREQRDGGSKQGMQSTQAPKETAEDLGQFDGSADPNPGGRLGWGWHLRMDGVELPPRGGELPAAPGNTNNVGEFMGLISLLEDYLARGGKGPLEVRGDSQLIIRQVTGEYKCKAPNLQSLLAKAQSLTKKVPGGVSYVWVPRKHNSRADAAASGVTVQDPVAPPSSSFRDTWGNQTVLGKQLGLTAIEVGRKLRESGLRDASGKATEYALSSNLAKSTPLRDGTPFFLWHIEKVSAFLNKG